MSAADAYALSSLAVDLGIGEAVDIVNLVYAKIPKNIFKSNPEFWYKPAVAGVQGSKIQVFDAESRIRFASLEPWQPLTITEFAGR